VRPVRFVDRDGTKALVEVLLAHRSLPAEAVVAGMQRALAVCSIDPAVLIIEVCKAAQARIAPITPVDTALVRFDGPTPTLDHCDSLLAVEDEDDRRRRGRHRRDDPRAAPAVRPRSTAWRAGSCGDARDHRSIHAADLTGRDRTLASRR
jgi:hypothetical protein